MKPVLAPALSRFLYHVAADEQFDPPLLDDAADFLDELTDNELAEICGEPAGLRVYDFDRKALCYSSRLRQRIANGLMDLEALVEGKDGWLSEIGVAAEGTDPGDALARIRAAVR